MAIFAARSCRFASDAESLVRNCAFSARASAFALALVTSACDRLPGHPQYFVFLALRCAENRPLEVVVDGPRSSGCYLVDHLRQHIFLHLASLVAPDRRVGSCGWHRSPVHL